MPRPYLYQQAKNLRGSLGLTQRDAGEQLDPPQSQSYVSQVEQGKRTAAEERNYLLDLQKYERSRSGNGRPRPPREVGVARSAFGGDPLLPGFDYATTLSAAEGWRLFATSRTSPNTALGFLYHPKSSAYGLVGFYLIGARIRRGDILPITEKYDDQVSRALKAFADGTIKELSALLEELQEDAEEPTFDPLKLIASGTIEDTHA